MQWKILLAPNLRPMTMVTADPKYAVRPAQNSEGWWTVRVFRFEVVERASHYIFTELERRYERTRTIRKRHRQDQTFCPTLQSG